jgi:hypothetical protein
VNSIWAAVLGALFGLGLLLFGFAILASIAVVQLRHVLQYLDLDRDDEGCIYLLPFGNGSCGKKSKTQWRLGAQYLCDTHAQRMRVVKAEQRRMRKYTWTTGPK